MRPTAAPPLVRFPVATPVPALPYPFSFDAAHAALLVIDMQRDFLEPGGFGSALGNDVTLLRQVLPPLVRLLAACRANGMLIVHTREGHRPDLSDLPPAKLRRARSTATIGDLGPMGRILIRGEPGHDIVPELAPAAGELVIDKPGKGAFYATALQETLLQRGIRQLIVTGVTTEVCVHTTLREANDRGYDCLVPADCVGSYLPHLHAAALDMITAQNGIFGWVAPSAALLAALDWSPPSSPPPTSAPLPNCTAR